jgi:tripeptide aminopeptidase
MAHRAPCSLLPLLSLLSLLCLLPSAAALSSPGSPACPALFFELQDRLIRYARVDSQADPSSDSTPSSPGQWALLRLLHHEVSLLANESSLVEHFSLSPSGYLYIRVSPSSPAFSSCSRIAFFAHVDTALEVPATGVSPIPHGRVSNSDLHLSGGVIPNQRLRSLSLLNHTLVSSDGTTLLGADDKNAIAVLMSLLRSIVEERSLSHPPLTLVFSPDEEIGHMCHGLDVQEAGFPAAAYTLDASRAGDIQRENFNAEKVSISIEGVSIHPGSAKGILVNALTLLADLVSRMPQALAPENSEGRDGFILPRRLAGGIAEAHSEIFLRSFSTTELEWMRNIVLVECQALASREPRANITCTSSTTYRNALETQRDERSFDLLRQATDIVAGSSRIGYMRGGTDGAGLATFQIPSSNLGVGYYDAHSTKELSSVDDMYTCYQVIVALLSLWVDT